MKSSLLAIGIAGLIFVQPAMAEIGTGISVGTTGIGIHLSVPVQPTLNARVGVNGLNYSYDTSTDNVDYDLKLKLRTADLLLDWHPTATAFRVSGGVVYNGNKIDATGVPNAAGSYTLNGTTYSAANAGTIESRIDFRKAAPYLGVGWGNAAQNSAGWGISADLGVLFQGKPRSMLTSTGCTAPAPVCTQLATDLAAENVRLQDDLDSFRVYPVARIGINYRF